MSTFIRNSNAHRHKISEELKMHGYYQEIYTVP